MALPVGFNFRSTLGFVTDPANTKAELSGTADYPAAAFNGIVYGWEQAEDTIRDRNAGIDARLAGAHFTTSGSGTDKNFRIDLPATGAYDITLALGEPTYASVSNVDILDTTTVLFSPTANTAVSAAHWVDATGVDRNGAATWVSSNAVKTLTFGSTILRIKNKHPSSSSSALAHVNVASSGGGGATFNPGWAYGATRTIGMGVY